MYKNLNTYEAVVAMYNPTSTSHKRILREVEDLDIPVIMAQTHPDVRYTQDNLYASAEPGFAILGLGGDGTANQLGNIMMQNETVDRGLGDVPFVPLRGGNANDIARSYNGTHSVRTIVQTGDKVRMHPLAIEVLEPNHASTLRYALGYFSVGAAARAAGALEAIKTRSRYMHYGPQQVREIITTLRTVARSPEFNIDYGGAGRELASDVTFVRGRYIAKHGKLAADAGKNAYEHVSTPYAGYAGTALNMLRLGTGRLLGQLMQRPISFFVKSTDGQPLRLQYDGETAVSTGRSVAAASGSKITVGLSERSFTTLLVQ